MKNYLKKKVEEKVGELKTIHLLAEQGETSEVYKIETNQGIFLLKSSFNKKYRVWLAEEATILKKINELKQIPVPKYYGFIEGNCSSSLIMSFEKGTTLTTALKEAASVNDKKLLIKSFGKFIRNFHEKEPLNLLKQEPEWLERQLLKAQSYVDNRQTAGGQELLDQLKSKRPSSVKPTMIHGDCTTDNVLVIDDEVKFLICFFCYDIRDCSVNI